MICPYCKSKESQVIRSEKFDTVVRRWRRCKRCGNEFVTAEEIIQVLSKYPPQVAIAK
jgi:transcriptional regulator NrdR family protein